MRSELLIALTLALFASTPLAAQQPCPAAQRDAASVTRLRTTLRNIKLNEDSPDETVPPLAQKTVPDLKLALAQTAHDLLACTPINASPANLQNQLAALLHANPPQPPPGSSVMNGDKRYAEWLAFDYGRDLLVDVGRIAPNLLTIKFTFHIACGDDSMLLIFEPAQIHWRERLVWQARPYKEISGAFGDIFENVVLPATQQTPWRLVNVHGTPWCQSRFSGFAIDVLEPASDPTHPRTVWHTERSYSRTSDIPETLKASADTFELRVAADAMEFDMNSAVERRVIYRYRVTGDRVERLQPIALNARGFVEEWLSMPWSEAVNQAAATNSSLKALHHAFGQNRNENHNTFIQPAYGPVLACKTPKEFQVEMRASSETIVPNKPGGDSAPLPSTFYRLRDTGNGYQLLSASTQADPQCTGPNLMHDEQ